MVDKVFNQIRRDMDPVVVITLNNLSMGMEEVVVMVRLHHHRLRGDTITITPTAEVSMYHLLRYV
jgi:hypothetical protein